MFFRLKYYRNFVAKERNVINYLFSISIAFREKLYDEILLSIQTK